jgi:hypothetical protein
MVKMNFVRRSRAAAARCPASRRRRYGEGGPRALPGVAARRVGGSGALLPMRRASSSRSLSRAPRVSL